MKRTKKESAVSPVVGVMLMLVVTIIIAAVVATFASSVTTSTEVAPTAVLKAEVIADWDYGDYSTGNGTVFITSLSGDMINLSKVTVTVTKLDDKKSCTYEAPINSWNNKEYLKSGATLNLVTGEGSDPDTYMYTCLSKKLDTTINSGDMFEIVIVYDGTHVLYDKEVVAA